VVLVVPFSLRLGDTAGQRHPLEIPPKLELGLQLQLSL
jgi:hypothetical protein